MRFLQPRAALVPAVMGFALLAACSDPFGLPPPRSENAVDTVALFALDGTPLSSPSAYHLETLSVVRTDRSPVFDFAFNVDSLGRPVLLPTGPLRLGEGSGIRLMTTPFDSIKVAPGGGYERSKAVVVDAGTVAVVHSRPTPCSFGTTVFLYAKLQVLTIDAAARRIVFQILTNANCGYRGLEPGFPVR